MRASAAVLAILLCLPPLPSQTRDEGEARIAQLPPDQRAYERFRHWFGIQTPDIQKSPAAEQKYRAYLKTAGFSDSEIDAQLKLISDHEDELEAARWNRFLTAEKPRFNTAPNAFLVEMVKGRTPGAALDVGMGQGRNAIWLAQRGWSVTGFDPADKAVALANETAKNLGLHLNTEITTSERFDFGANRWDVILLSYAGGRDLTEKIEKGLKPHGILVIEAFHRDATKVGSIGPAVVFDTGELIRIFPDLRVVRYEEPLAVADFGQNRVRLVRYCGEKVD